MTFKKGKLYRNKFMKDIDFYVIDTNDKHVIGYWIYRRNGKIAKDDQLNVNRIRLSAWSEVTEQNK